jgi:glutathione S-transferase
MGSPRRKPFGRQVCIKSSPSAPARRTLVEGSRTIINWAESKAQNRDRRLTPAAGLAEAEASERRADEVIDVHVRRLAYAKMLPRHSHLVKAALFQPAPGWHRLVGGMMWPVTRRLMMRVYDVRPGAAAESKAKLETELDWLDGKLADGRAYLAGDRFSRADITVASLLAAYARPKEMPVYEGLAVPDALADTRRWSERPTMRWVIAQYRAHRRPMAR